MTDLVRDEAGGLIDLDLWNEALGREKEARKALKSTADNFEIA